jgi:hypothetical protein
MNHGTAFQAAAGAMGLVACGTGKQPWKSTKGGDTFQAQYGLLLDSLGEYPHGQLSTAADSKVQPTRMLKLCCASCGYTVRTTAKWVAVGVPTCPCGDTFSIV